MKFKPQVKNALYLVFQLSEILKKDRPEVPPTREELAGSGTSKKHLKDLEQLGLIKAQIMVVTESYKGGGKTTHGRCVYRLTSLGYEVCHQLGFVPVQDTPIDPPIPEPVVEVLPSS